jgi:hypothetical protein
MPSVQQRPRRNRIQERVVRYNARMAEQRQERDEQFTLRELLLIVAWVAVFLWVLIGLRRDAAMAPSDEAIRNILKTEGGADLPPVPNH